MNTAHKRSYEFEPIVIGRGLDEFAREEALLPSTFEIEDVRHGPPAALRAFESEVPVARVTPVATVATVSPRSSTAVRSAGRRYRLAISSAVSMIAVAASVGAALTAAWVLTAIALLSRTIESRRARRRKMWQPIGLQWVAAAALRHRRSTVATFSVALLAVALFPLWNPPAVSPVAAVSTSTSPQASIQTVDVAASRHIDLRAAALQPEPVAAASLERPVVPTTLTAAAQSAGPERQSTVYRGRTLDFQPDIPRRPPVLLAVAEHDPPSPTAAEPIPVPVAIVSAALEVPKPAAAEPGAYVPSAVGPAPDTVTADRSAIDDVLAAYRRSYNSLDAGAVSAIWRGADTRALARAFSTLTRQHMTFDRCDVRVTAADRAHARCDGILSYVQKAGDSTPQQRRVSWSMDLGRPDDRWVIVGVQAR